MSDARDDRSPDALRVLYLDRLIRASEERYGRERTEELRATLAQVAEHMVKVALFPLDNEDRPGFLGRATDARQ